MRRLYWLAPLAGLCAVALFAMFKPRPTTAEPEKANGAAAGPALPISRAGTITGSIRGVEQQRVPSKDGAVEVDVVSLWCAEGVRSVKLADVQRLRFLSPATESECRRALDTLALSHDAQKKAVSLNF